MLLVLLYYYDYFCYYCYYYRYHYMTVTIKCDYSDCFSEHHYDGFVCEGDH